MPSPTETGSKKHILAERFLENGVPENLCFLFVADFRDIQVLSVYSELSKKLLAYKLVNRNAGVRDLWLDAGFQKTVFVDFNPGIELLPPAFADPDTPVVPTEAYSVQPHSPEGYRHYATGLFRYNLLRPETVKLYLFVLDDKLSLFLFREKECLFCNTFVYKNETEFLYYLLNSLQVNDCSQDGTTIFLDYTVASDKTLREFIGRYFADIRNLGAELPEPDMEIPFLTELLFPNHLLSLCE